MSINLTPEELEDMLDRAARRGATEALKSMGLQDDDARRDLTEMRTLLEAYRDTKKSIWSTIVKITTVGLLTFIAASVWMQIGNK
jgi:2-iminoacetate synthase ThiH